MTPEMWNACVGVYIHIYIGGERDRECIYLMIRKLFKAQRPACREYCQAVYCLCSICIRAVDISIYLYVDRQIVRKI